MAHARAELIILLLTIRSFSFCIGLLLVDDLDRLIIIIILTLRCHLSCRAHGGRLVHHVDLLLNFCTVLSILIFKSGLVLHISLLVLCVRECLLHLLLLLTPSAGRVSPLALVSRLRHRNFLAILEGCKVSLLLAFIHVGLLVFVK